MHLPGFIGITQQDCESRKCCWQPVEAGFGTASNQPWCFHANEGHSEYELITTTPTGTFQQTHSAMHHLCCLHTISCFWSTHVSCQLLPKPSTDVIMLHADNGWKGVLRNLTSTQPELGPDITTLQVTADTSQSDILHICITDLHDTRWRVPAHFYPDLSDGASCKLHPAIRILPSAHGT